MRLVHVPFALLANLVPLLAVTAAAAVAAAIWFVLHPPSQTADVLIVLGGAMTPSSPSARRPAGESPPSATRWSTSRSLVAREALAGWFNLARVIARDMLERVRWPNADRVRTLE